MRADWDDAPLRLKRNSRNGNSMRVAVITVLLAAVLGYVLFSKGWLSNVDLLIDPQGPYLLSEQPLMKPEAGQPVVQPDIHVPSGSADIWLSDTSRSGQPGADRQTIFNDSNYRPSNQINIIASFPVTQPRTVVTQQPTGLNGRSLAIVEWIDARGRRTTWNTTFSFQRSVIDNYSFCGEQRRGSIEYRECRKGAREWLKGQCRTSRDIALDLRRMYCHAHASFRT